MTRHQYQHLREIEALLKVARQRLHVGLSELDTLLALAQRELDAEDAANTSLSQREDRDDGRQAGF